MTCAGYPWRSAQRRYMRMSISAKSAASTPPAPARIVMTAARSSYSPDSRVRTSSSPTAFWSEASSRSASAIVSASPPSSVPISTSTSRSSMRESMPVTRSYSELARLSADVTCCAASGSSQRSGAEALASRSAICTLRAARSVTSRTESMVVRRFLISCWKSTATKVNCMAPPDARRPPPDAGVPRDEAARHTPRFDGFRRAGSDDQAEQEHEHEPRDRQQRLHQGPRLDGLADREAEVLLDQPEARVVDVGEEHRAGPDREHEQRHLGGAHAGGQRGEDARRGHRRHGRRAGGQADQHGDDPGQQQHRQAAALHPVGDEGADAGVDERLLEAATGGDDEQDARDRGQRPLEGGGELLAAHPGAT